MKTTHLIHACINPHGFRFNGSNLADIAMFR